MDPDGGSLVLQLLFIVVLILVNAFFAASEMAVVTANDQNIERLADGGNPKAKRLIQMLSQPSNFLASIQVGITFAGLLASAAASESFSNRIAQALSGVPLPASLIKAISVAIITLALSYFQLVLGELVPKRLAMHRADSVALHVTGVLHFVSVAFRPFVWMLAVSTNTITRLFGVSEQPEDRSVTEEQIRMMVDMGEEKGTIGESEKEMINNVFEFDDRIAADIMTHRTDISAADITSKMDEVVSVALSEGYSRIPIYEDDLDNIVGVIYVKDLLRYVGKPLERAITPKDVMRPPLFVPETKKCRELFGVLTARKQHMAVVIDEYGGTAGIVTMEDLVESIVGDIQDEYDHEEEEFSVIDESNFFIEGTANLEEVGELLEVNLPEGEYDTIAGLIIDRIGHIPAPGEHPSVEIGDVTFTVEDVEDRRIEKVRAHKTQQETVPPDGGGSPNDISRE
ncbi:MAG: hemolysin family protein [Ethanoligenens sp.]